jgi:hypothetical protein
VSRYNFTDTLTAVDFERFLEHGFADIPHRG